jgi:hypothetical protein
MRLLFLVLLAYAPVCCRAQYPNRPIAAATVFPAGNTLARRFPPPAGYERSPVNSASFSAYLQQLPLQPHGSKVHYFDGRLKPNTAAYCAVIRMEIGNRDLQQCADAVMRLRGEYLFANRQWDQLGFAFGDGRMHYFSQTGTDRSYTCFRKWMDQVCLCRHPLFVPSAQTQAHKGYPAR